MMTKKIIGLLFVALMVSGCAFIQDVFDGIDWEEIIEATEQEQPQPNEPTPTPIPAEEQLQAPVFYTTQSNSTLPVGVCVATEAYLPGGKQTGNSSISVISITVKSSYNSAKWISKDYKSLILKSPDNFYNWNLSRAYAYTTRYATNPDTGYITNADGTSRGIAILGCERTGLWDVYVKAALTENRGGAYIGVTVKTGETKTTYWHRWVQRSDKSQSKEYCIGTKIRFVPKGN